MEIPYEVTARRDTGLYNAKVGIWLFLASEVMLFGGLFSAYVFLRVGIDPAHGDIPWPIGVQKVWVGFTNTLVLIASSVFVVLSWLALKERNWRKFQWWMSAVIACALTFMALKAYEYTYKFSHHGIVLTDGSVLEGVIKNKTDRIEFEATGVTLSLKGALPGFTSEYFKPKDASKAGHEAADSGGGHEAKADHPVDWKRANINELNLYAKLTRTEPIPLEEIVKEFEKSDEVKLAKEEEIEVEIPNFRKWYLNQGAEMRRVTAKVRSTARKLAQWEIREAEKNDREPRAALLGARFGLKSNAEIVAKDDEGEEIVPFTLLANPRSLQGHDEESLSFKDAVIAKGHLKNDTVSIEVHEVDLQMVAYEDQEDALAWTLIEAVEGGGGSEQKALWFEAREKSIEEIADWYKKRDRPVPRKQKQSRTVSLQEIHLGHHGAKKGTAPDPGDAGSEDAHESEDPSKYYVSVARDQVKFMSNHGPRYHPYYAIYFTLTGLHGLHVVGGALVLAYMMIFGKKLFLRNPEHMANRVEVGGLFWHFVDLVWIFLFPIMYLL